MLLEARKRLILVDRVQLLGWITEEEKARWMAGAFAALYLPYNEDSYGYVTLEAFHSHKPVLTFTDSGGTDELIEAGVNGLVLEPTPLHRAERLSGELGVPVLLKRDDLAGTGLTYIGCKDVGATPARLRDLVARALDGGLETMLEVVSTSEDAEIRSISAAGSIGVDWGSQTVVEVQGAMVSSNECVTSRPGWRTVGRARGSTGRRSVIE